MKQTAVEWLEKEITKRGPISGNPPSWMQELYAQAKEMEREQIIQAHNHGYWVGDDVEGDDETYYNERYGNK